VIYPKDAKKAKKAKKSKKKNLRRRIKIDLE